MRFLVNLMTVTACATLFIGAAFPIPRDGRGHLITEYAGVFQALDTAANLKTVSIVYYDDHLYAAERGWQYRRCLFSQPDVRSGGLLFHPGSLPAMSGSNAHVFISELNGLNDYPPLSRQFAAFWSRVSDQPNVDDMFEIGPNGERRYCVPQGLRAAGVSPLRSVPAAPETGLRAIGRPGPGTGPQ